MQELSNGIFKEIHASMKINLCQMGVPDDPGITSHKFKCAKLARWVYASQQAIPSRVRELSKTIPIRVSKLHRCDPFFVPEAFGHFYWFSGSSCVDSAVCIFIRFQCFECYKQNCANHVLGLCISKSHTFSRSGAFKNHCHSFSKV
jgi:hypothetical protein